jgi:beta-lactamase class A
VTELDAVFDAADVDGYLHAIDLDTGAEVGHSADAPVVLASVFKIPVLVTLFRCVDADELDPAEQVLVPAGDRTPGPYGLSVMRDAATLSWRDLAWLMMSISDNAATDIVCERLGIDTVNAAMDELGVPGVRLVGDCADLFDTMRADLGLPETAPLDDVDVSDRTVAVTLRAITPLQTTRATARDMTTLLGLVWSDRAATPDSCAQMRRILGQQVWPHRLASGFPEPDITTSGKTGTLPTWRNEVGVVAYPDERRYAVAVFTQSRTTVGDPRGDAAIGAAARAAVQALRVPVDR